MMIRVSIRPLSARDEREAFGAARNVSGDRSEPEAAPRPLAVGNVDGHLERSDYALPSDVASAGSSSDVVFVFVGIFEYGWLELVVVVDTGCPAASAAVGLLPLNVAGLL